MRVPLDLVAYLERLPTFSSMGSGIIAEPAYYPIDRRDERLGSEPKDEETRKATLGLWAPLFLRCPVIIAFLCVFTAILFSPTVLFVYAERQGRSLVIKMEGNRYYYLSTYGANVSNVNLLYKMHESIRTPNNYMTERGVEFFFARRDSVNEFWDSQSALADAVKGSYNCIASAISVKIMV